ncbi:hypothetical protein CWE14_03020 [Aliidiomarina soli]|uniref:D-2-hydroxyglutarate dehydrogenase n=1 Tax=Aliidiomarina soli TaxID=1928574 RepID=A0A432WMD6_9GAMM|nr:FAD-binding and (Fe-S)-binding domain-containing protein [Aliidiomarina soli]RUO34980.1 hypothetical protein CWE14_03020 [Aliidiomarina soli]
MLILPTLSPEQTLQPEYEAFIQALERTAFSGDIDLTYAGRLIASTDNSIYQQLPQGVVYPRTQEDVGIVMALAAQAAHQQIQFSPRGGGTGTNGQSLTSWLVLDLSRYLTRVLEINIEEGWVRVESGLVKDALNKALAPHGFFFAPDTSTSNRCTLGGMINTDASGQGSLVYGKTSDHILELASYTLHGTRLTTRPIPLKQARELAQLATPEGGIYQQVIKSCVDLRGEVVKRFPPLNRFLTGYDLKHAYDADSEQVDLSRLIAGSEGTLAVVTEAKLNITRIPRHKVLVNVTYSSFQSALRHAPALVEAQATSVETIDSKVLDLARNDIVWHGVKDMLESDSATPMDGINMVEFTATSEYALEKKLTSLTSMLDDSIRQQNGVIGYQICDDPASIGRIYAMRKKAVGLLGATKGARKPIAFVEDTAVPPEHLADYISEFRDLLDAHQLNYGMFGHVDAGVLHVRPALNMQDPEDEALVRTISDQVVALTAKYKGLMWGEHGKGFRSEYGPEFFGELLYQELCKLKAVFDPLNRLNPGKICTPYQSQQALVSVDATKRGWFDRQIPLATQGVYQTAMDCNGNGLCFNFDKDTPMCPSYRVTGDRRYSPKGRASLLREWLRLTSLAGLDAGIEPKARASWWQRWRNRKQTDDFNHEVKASMDECLACKACGSQCPVKVDIPSHRARFLAHYHSRYGRPLKDYLVKNIEHWLPRMAAHPRLINSLMGGRPGRWVSAELLGYVDAPNLSVPALTRRDAYRKALSWQQFLELRQGNALNEAEQSHFVGIVQDPFTSFYEAELVEDLLKLAARLGVQAVILPYRANGKAAHVKGFLAEFRQLARVQAQQLQQAADMGLPLVGLDASTVLCYADEYQQFLGAERGNFKVKLVQQWLQEDVDESILRDFIKPVPAPASHEQPVDLLLHCTEQTELPQSGASWQQIFAKVGVECRPLQTGCCGMAGTYGHEAEHQAKSKQLYAMSWQPKLASSEKPLATGFSCRCQAQRVEQRRLQHPLQHLLQVLS